MMILQSFELVAVLLVWTVVLLGIIAFKFDDERGWVIVIKIVVIAAWVWGTLIPGAAFLLSTAGN